MSKKLAKEWINFAFTNLRNIEHIFHNDFPIHIVVFHYQQCIEKCFKAFRVINLKKVLRSYSIIRLVLFY